MYRSRRLGLSVTTSQAPLPSAGTSEHTPSAQRTIDLVKGRRKSNKTICPQGARSPVVGTVGLTPSALCFGWGRCSNWDTPPLVVGLAQLIRA